MLIFISIRCSNQHGGKSVYFLLSNFGSNPSLYKRPNKEFKINGFQIKVLKSINFKINEFQIKQIEWLYNIFNVILVLQIEVSGGILVILDFKGPLVIF